MSKKRSKSPQPREVAPPQLFTLGKDSTYFPGQWLSAGGQIKKVGIPTAAQHRFFGGSTEAGVRQGQGLEIIPGNHTYSGNFENGVRSGLGVLATTKQSVYRGGFAEGKISGQGRFRLSSADTIDASWVDNRLQGHGKAAFANGMVYDGSFESNRISGSGQATYADGSKYDGEWKDGVRSGKGTLIMPDGCVYTGDWLNDKEHGFGTVTYPSGSRFSGQWENGRKLLNRPTTAARLAPGNPASSLSDSFPQVHPESAHIVPEGSFAGRTLNSAKSTFRTDMSNDVAADYPSCTYASDIADSFVVPIAESPEPATEPQLLRTPTNQSTPVTDFNKFVPHLPLQQRPATGISRPSSRMSARERTRSLNSVTAEKILRTMNVRDLGLHPPTSPPRTPLSTNSHSKFLTPIQPRLQTSHAFSRKDADKTPQPPRGSLPLSSQSPLPPVMSW